MTHEESKLQQQCVAWFRLQYPEFAMLLTHPANEGNGNRISGAIHKAEGTVAGVSDLLFFLPSGAYGEICYGLGIELKTKTGRQSPAQKKFSKFFVAAGYYYVIVRSLEEFKRYIDFWISQCPKDVYETILRRWQTQQVEELQHERELIKQKFGKK